MLISLAPLLVSLFLWRSSKKLKVLKAVTLCPPPPFLNAQLEGPLTCSSKKMVQCYKALSLPPARHVASKFPAGPATCTGYCRSPLSARLEQAAGPTGSMLGGSGPVLGVSQSWALHGLLPWGPGPTCSRSAPDLESGSLS